MQLCARTECTNSMFHFRSITGRGEEAEGGEEAVPVAKAKLPADR